MASYIVNIKISAQKEIRKLPSKDLRGKVADIINVLEYNPFPEESKKIKGSNNVYRIRCGVYGVVYAVYKKELLVLVIRVQHKKVVQKSLK